MDSMSVNHKEYEIVSLLGKGKGGYSYLVTADSNQYSDEWNFENRGINFWSKTKEFVDYAEGHNK